MSIDISQLTARLDPERQEAVKAQYEEHAISPTAAFLLCFFLGSAGAHRFYLKEWRVGFAHLALFALGAAALIAGLFQTLPLTTELASHPVGFALDVVGVLLLLAALIWEIIDLGRIDHQVYHRNLLLAEGIIAANLLADQSVVEGARQRLDEAMQQTHAQPHTEAAPAATAAAAGVITANEVADARALAEQVGGLSSISYTEVSQFDVSADPDPERQAQADALREGNWTETTTIAETLPAATPDAAPATLTETTTHTHTEDGPRVTDSYEIDRVATPSVAEVAGLGAAGLGEAAHASGFDEPTLPDYAAYATPAETEAAPAETAPTEAAYIAPAEAAPVYAEPAYVAPMEPFAEFDTTGESSKYDFDDGDIGDVTDASMPAIVAPTADIAFGASTPAFVRLPDEYAEPAAPEEPSAPLYIAPEEPTTDVYPYAPEPVTPAYEAPIYEAPIYEAPASVEPSADAFVPPVASVFSGSVETPTAPTPSWDQPTTPQPEPMAAEPEPAPLHHDTLAEAAGVAGLAGAGALAAEAFAHSHEPEPVAAAEPVAAEPVAAAEPAAPEPQRLRKIRVKRAAVLDGKVVGEMVVEGEVLPGETPQEAANRIQAEMGHYTPEQIARAANLSSNEEVELHQRSEGPTAE